MTHSILDLKSGKLKGSKTLKLACGLTEFPEEILSLSETLEFLDLSNNQLSELPDSIVQLKSLKILFFAHNQFTIFPKVLGLMPQLRLVGFKSNKIEVIPENAFPPLLKWLVLTDNKIKEIPRSIGNCSLLQKCGLAGNQLTELPNELAKCTNLQLLRISANRLTAIPSWLFELPKLYWIAFAGNPGSLQVHHETEIESFDWNEFTVLNQLGEGASGVISKAHWLSKNKAIALKVFKGEVTSDGLPQDEMNASIASGRHENLIQVAGKIHHHPEGKNGLILELIDPTYFNLGNPPSLESCTRDVLNGKLVLSEKDILKIAKSIASVCVQLHGKGINHGDLYAHNILINEGGNCLLGDFGAASFYDINSPQAPNIERIEVGAYGCLIEDLLSLCNDKEIQALSLKRWQDLINRCLNPVVGLRPRFSDILKSFEAF